MKRLRIDFAGFAVVRSPLLPLDAFAASAPVGDDPEAALRARNVALRDFLRTTPIREALATASPSLATALARAPADDVLFAAMRYVARMRGRSTPFGLCAGYSLVPTIEAAPGPVEGPPPTARPVGSRAIRLAPQRAYEAILRVDVDAISAANERRGADAGETRRQTLWVTSGELVTVGDLLRVARRDVRGDVSLADVRRTATVDRFLDLPSEGTSFDGLVARIADVVDARGPREAFVDRLIDEGILVPRDSPAIATDDEIATLARRIAVEHLPPSDPLHEVVAVARARRSGPIEPSLLDATRALERALSPSTSSGRASRACIHDLWKPIEDGFLGEDLRREIEDVVHLLRRVTAPSRDDRHRRFAEHLAARYETRAIPLALALDPDAGFDFPPEREAVRDTTLDAFRLQLLADALVRGEREILLTEAMLPTDTAIARPSLAGFALQTGLLHTADGFALAVPRLVDSPGTLFFARATALSSALRDHTRAFLSRQAEAEDDILAELAYVVPGRSAAFLQYPPLAPTAITYATRPGLPREGGQIPIDDLLVRSLGTRTEIVSRTTGRRVRVLPIGAANPNLAHVAPIARFLLTHAEAMLGSGFSWGNLAGAPYLPRVRYGRHVLAPAQWTLDARATAPLRNAKTVRARWEATQTLRRERRLPRHVLFLEGADRALPIDLDDVLAVEAWLDIATERMTLAECVDDVASAIVGPEGAYRHELAIPLLTTPPPRTTKARHLASFDEAATFDRILPGGECLFLSIYGPRSALVPLVTDTLRDPIVDALESGDARSWFFLPYSDPDPHLRLRFFGDPAALYGRLLPAIHAALAPLVARHAIRLVRIDTYERETVRYGGCARVMDACEALFRASSEAAVAFHDALLERSDPDDVEVSDEVQLDDRGLLVPVVASLRAMMALMGEPPEGLRRLALAAGEGTTRTDDRVLPKRRAGAMFRGHRLALLAPPDPDTRFGRATAARFRDGFAELARACDEAKRDRRSILVDLMHVHTVRLLTTWCPVANLEPIAYFTIEKILAAEDARRR